MKSDASSLSHTKAHQERFWGGLRAYSTTGSNNSHDNQINPLRRVFQ